jgi:dipeptidyl aminopeptidase/acylaminoacyl peptidase
MRTEQVRFYSRGSALAGTLMLPDDASAERPVPGIAQGPGWLGLRDAKLYKPYHEALLAAGMAVLVFDYRGFGDSEGDQGILSPAGQLTDLRNAVTYLTTRDDVIADAIGCFGTGGTGGGNAVLLAGVDPRIRAVVSQVPVADGRDWLHRMRQEHEWIAYLSALEEDAKLRVTTGHGRTVHPREEIMIPTPERKTTTIKADVDERIPTAISLASAEQILEYRPIDAADGHQTPLMVIVVEADATTPTDHAEALYEVAAGPKALIMQRKTSHYAAYDRYWTEVTPRIVEWFERYVRPADVRVESSAGSASIENLEVAAR